jgi:hypothetical protein
MKIKLGYTLSLILVLLSTTVCIAQTNTQPPTLLELLMSAVPSAVGTLIGAGITLFGVRWSSNRQWKLEEKKWFQARTDEMSNEIRQSVAELVKNLAAEIQAILWLTWIAKYQPETFSENDINLYDQDMKLIFREVSAARAILATLDPKVYKDMSDLEKEVSAIDHFLAFPSREFKHSKDLYGKKKALESLGSFYDNAYNLYLNLPDRVGSILAGRMQNEPSLIKLDK